MKLQDFNKVYFSVLLLHLAVLYKPESMALYYISKPLLIFSLLSYFIHKTEAIASRYRISVILGLAFSLCGDVMLMLEGQHWFLGGMASFALAHLAYISFYFQLKLDFRWIRIMAALTISFASFIALISYVGTPAEMQIFIYAYATLLIIHLMVSTGFIQKSIRTSVWPPIGVSLFIVSDLLLAYHMYKETNKWLQIAVMIAYGLAQYLIAVGVLKSLGKLIPDKSKKVE